MTEPTFFVPARRLELGEIAALTGARLLDESKVALQIGRLAAASEGGEDSLVFVDGKRNASLLTAVRAAAVICDPESANKVPKGVAVLVSDRPQHAFAQVARLLFPSGTRPQPITGETGVSPRAVVGEGVTLEEGVIIEPGAIIGRNVAIGQGTVVGPNAVIADGCSIGRECFVGSQCTIQFALIGDRVIIHPGTQIGQDGFGFLPGPTGLVKNPQIGRVIIQNDVEIGANTTVDRGALSDTVIGEGSKIDNLVQIAHNVKIGRSCVIAAHCGISGSVTIGDMVMMGGRVGIADHIVIGSKAQLAAGSGVMNDIPAGEKWAGSPAQPIRQAFREIAALRSLVEGKRKGK